ncbi:MAG: GntR family transcriptional regulator [Lachnospiraceae bacterium]|nr:GntR family transcriptional regulator [Lachnospiraceae bacterium]
MNLVKSTLSEQIYQILRTDILMQKIPFGERLTLKNLQARFDVSSTPIREALTRLSEDELVVYYSNVGVKVIELSKEDLCEMYRFIGDMDALAIRYASESPDQERLLKELEENITYTKILDRKESLTEEETKQWIARSDRFHLMFYDYCGNSCLTRAAEKLRSRLSIFSNKYEASFETQKKIEAYHERIYEAYYKKEYETAVSLMQQHLKESFTYAAACLDERQKREG